jgi:NAD dependent epimerase/dehydratase family enzyme
MKILIAGGSGMIGKNITDLLLSQGHRVTWLSRNSFESNKFSCLTWAELPQSNYSPDILINLAGTTWTVDGIK